MIKLELPTDQIKGIDDTGMFLSITKELYDLLRSYNINSLVMESGLMVGYKLYDPRNYIIKLYNEKVFVPCKNEEEATFLRLNI